MLRVKYGANIEIVVKRATVRSDLNRQFIAQQLLDGEPDDARGLWTLFAELCSVTTRARGLPFDPAAMASADKPTLDAAYLHFLDFDKELRDRWFGAMNKANGPIDDVTGPEPLPEGADPND